MIDLVKIIYDWGLDGAPPGAGDYLRGQGVRGPSPRAYRIYSARLVKSAIHQGRYSLECERIRAVDIPAGARVCTIIWHSRAKKR